MADGALVSIPGNRRGRFDHGWRDTGVFRRIFLPDAAGTFDGDLRFAVDGGDTAVAGWHLRAARGRVDGGRSIRAGNVMAGRTSADDLLRLAGGGALCGDSTARRA